MAAWRRGIFHFSANGSHSSSLIKVDSSLLSSPPIAIYTSSPSLLTRRWRHRCEFDFQKQLRAVRVQFVSQHEG